MPVWRSFCLSNGVVVPTPLQAAGRGWAQGHPWALLSQGQGHSLPHLRSWTLRNVRETCWCQGSLVGLGLLQGPPALGPLLVWTGVGSLLKATGVSCLSWLLSAILRLVPPSVPLARDACPFSPSRVLGDGSIYIDDQSGT